MEKDREEILKKYAELFESKSAKKDYQKKLGVNAAATLAATGMPIAAVSVSGSVSGISAAGITSGLATLGAGTMVGGIAVVAGIGVVSFIGVKWIVSKI